MNIAPPLFLRPLGQAARRTRRGFALIVTLSLMTLLLLLVLALTTLVQLNLSAAKTTLYNTEAKQNALLAAYIGLGQLQKFAGPDQRVTTTADLGRFAVGQEPGADNGFAPGSFFAGFGINGNGALPKPVSPTPAPFGALAAFTRAGTRYWTAVWGEGTNPLGLYTGQSQDFNGSRKVTPEPILMNWLVSGDENTPLMAHTYVGGKVGNGVVEALSALSGNYPTFGSDTSGLVSQGSPDTSTWNALTSDITINNSVQTAVPAVVLVGPNSAGTNNDQKITVETGPGGTQTIFNKFTPLNNMVVVPVVNILEPAESTTGTVTSGRYAWFVQDEGVKAKFNIVDPDAGQTTATTAGTNGQLSRYRFNAPMRTGIERMFNMTSYFPGGGSAAISSPLVYSGNMATELNNILEPSQMLLIDPSLPAVQGATNASLPEQTLQIHYHDFTPYSYGVLADALRGGLRYDLTAAFEPGNSSTLVFQDPTNSGLGGNGLFGHTIIPAGTTGAPTFFRNTTEPNVVGATATSEQLINADGSNSQFHGPAAPDLAHQQQPGLKWDVLQSYYALAGNNTTGGRPAVMMRSATSTQAGISPVILEARLRFGNFADQFFEQYIAVQPLFVLANPYNFPITAPPGGLDLGYRINTDTKWEWGFSPSARNQDRNNGNPVINASNPGGNTVPTPSNQHGSGVGLPFGYDLTQNRANATIALNAAYGGDIFYSQSANSKSTLNDYSGTSVPESGYFPFLKNPVSFTNFIFPTSDNTNQRYNSVLDQMAFHIPQSAAVFQPGEAKVFILDGNFNEDANFKVATPPYAAPSDSTFHVVGAVGTANGTTGTAFSFTMSGNQIAPINLQAKIPNINAGDNLYILRDTGINTGSKIQLLPTVAPVAGNYDLVVSKGNVLGNNPSTAQLTTYATNNPWPSPQYGYISTMFGSVAMTLELRYDLTPPQNTQSDVLGVIASSAGALFNPSPVNNSTVFGAGASGSSWAVAAVGTNVLQSITNLDLTGDGYYADSGNVFTMAGSINPQAVNGYNPSQGEYQGYRRQYIGSPQGFMPAYLSDYAFAMSLPGNFDNPSPAGASPNTTESVLFQQDNGSGGINGTFDPGQQGTYRTYYDYNLRAANMNLPPFVPLNTGTTSANQTLPAATGFINLPPYGRTFSQGPGNDDSVNPTLGYDTFANGLGSNSSFDHTAHTPGANATFDTAWGYALGGNYNTESQGQQFCVLYGIPQRAANITGTVITNPNTGQSIPDVPILSLGQLQHADVTADDLWVSVGYEPGNAIGNSYADFFVTRAASVQTHKISDAHSTMNPNGWASSVLVTPANAGNTSNSNQTTPLYNNGAGLSGNTGTGPLLTPASPANAYDISYLMNVALWDRYFFSTLSQTGPSVIPANNRLKYAAGYVPTATMLGTNGSGNAVVDPATGLTMFRAYAPARYMMIDGAFNINSTSVEAWRAILSALRKVALASGTGTDSSGNPVAYFPRNTPSPTLPRRRPAAPRSAPPLTWPVAPRGKIPPITPASAN